MLWWLAADCLLAENLQRLFIVSSIQGVCIPEVKVKVLCALGNTNTLVMMFL